MGLYLVTAFDEAMVDYTLVISAVDAREAVWHWKAECGIGDGPGETNLWLGELVPYIGTEMPAGAARVREIVIPEPHQGTVLHRCGYVVR